MAKDQNTFAKRKREMDKKRKAEDKRARRQRKKEQAEEAKLSPDNGPETEQ
jgi:hypothetical protein